MGHHEQCLRVLLEKFGTTPIVGVEIGTAAGDLTKTLLWGMEKLSLLYTIDPWTYRPGTQFESSQPQEHHDIVKEMSYKCLHEFGDRVRILNMTSDEAFSMIKFYFKMDFVWIDGDHEAAQVKKDVDNYEQIVRPGGLIGGHDYGQVPQLTEVIKAKYGDKIHEGDDFCWWVYL